MKRNTSFARNIISNCEGSPQLQKIELKRQKKNFVLGQAIDDYNLKKRRQHSFHNNTPMHNSSSNILNTSNYNTNNSNNTTQNNNKTARTKPSISSIPVQKYKQKGPNTHIITTGENIPLNLLEIVSNENDKALLFKYKKFNNETDVDSIMLKMGTIRINLLAKYISTCLSVISDYRTILNHPIIKSIEKDENSILIQKQLLNMKLYIFNFIQQLPENKKNEQIKEYSKYLEKEIELGKKLGIDSDSYEINYLFNFFPKGIEIICDYDALEMVYYNSKKNNKISGKALLPSPEFCFKLDLDKIGIKFFEFEFEIEDLEDIKLILSEIWKIIQEKLKVAKLFIEPCLSQAKIDLEAKQKEKEKDKDRENTKKKEKKYSLIENIKLKNNNINSLNTKTNTTDLTLTNNINEIKTMNNKNINIIGGKKNYTYTTVNLNNNIIKNIEKNLNLNKTKNNDNNIGNDNNENRIKIEKKKIVIPLMKEDSEDEDNKTKSRNEEDNEVKNVLDDLDDEKSQITNKNEFFKDDNFGSNDINISEDINDKKL
jgi:hypothetical protein